MATDFSGITAIERNNYLAAHLLSDLQRVYMNIVRSCAPYEKYVAGTDAGFNTAVNSVFTPAQRAALGPVYVHLQALRDELLANHFDVINWDGALSNGS